MPGNARNALAALAAGLSTVGENINRRKEKKDAAALADQQAEASSRRALAMLVKGKEIDNANENIWEKAEPMTQDDGSVIMVHQNKRTGEYAPVTIADTPVPQPSAAAGMDAITGSRTPLLRRPGMSMPVESPVAPPAATEPPVPDRQYHVGVPDDASNIPPTSPPAATPPAPPAVAQDTVPKPRTLRPYVKPQAAPRTNRTSKAVMVDGVPAVIMIANDGSAPTTAQGLPVTGKITPYVPPTKPGAGPGGGGLGSGGISGGGRFISGVGGLHNANDNMIEYENQVSTGTANFNGLDYYKKLWGQMYDEKGIVDPAIHATVMANLGTTNPALANYLQSAEMWAMEDASISNRPSDFRTKLDGFVSALKPNQTPKGIQQMQHGRQVRLDGYDAAVPAMKATMDRIAGTSGGGAGSPLSEADWAKANPAKKGETFDAYHARYLASQKRP